MNTSRCLGVIPARYASTRLPAKPLADIGGKSVVQRVWEQATRATLVSEVVVATDDQRIFEHATAFGARVIMTGSHHLTGSDRVAEAMEIMAREGSHFDFCANIQGDMPFIEPAVIDLTIQALAEAGTEIGMSTVAIPLLDEEEFLRPTAVKVVVSADRTALYFSRAPIPHRREPHQHTISREEPYGYKHMGLYVFRPDTLRLMATLPPTILDRREALEQLRALAHGVRIKVAIVEPALMQRSIEIDTPEDLSRAIMQTEKDSRR